MAARTLNQWGIRFVWSAAILFVLHPVIHQVVEWGQQKFTVYQVTRRAERNGDPVLRAWTHAQVGNYAKSVTLLADVLRRPDLTVDARLTYSEALEEWYRKAYSMKYKGN